MPTRGKDVKAEEDRISFHRGQGLRTALATFRTRNRWKLVERTIRASPAAAEFPVLDATGEPAQGAISPFLSVARAETRRLGHEDQ